ncbi:MAG: protein translocase subunit SecF [Chloroflexi bacterium]|nr:protein translocase subunit SecF [Chloroflexota bacterium]
MFNLVKYRYLFLIISLLVIVPGAISLALFGLNVGIDFQGGATVDLRPQRNVTAAEMTALLQPFHLQDLQIVTGNNQQMQAGKTVWVRLNTQIDKNVQSSIQQTLTQKYPGVSVTFSTIPATAAGGKAFTLVTVVGFSTVPQVSDIQTALAKLPNTSDPTKDAFSNTTTAATPTAAPGVTKPTPTAKATATPAGKGTPAATSTTTAKVTPTVTATANANNPANIPVSVQDVTQGATTQTIEILTRSTVKAEDIPKIQASFLQNHGPYLQLISNSEVGPSVAGETTRNAVLAVIAASCFILLYIWFSFRKLAKAWRYGTCAIIAMLHDVLVVVGIFSILGKLFNVQIDALFITALLTVVGFSVHDTIVVFDRIRENLHRRTTETFEQVVNASLVQTMARSLNTSLTVLFTLLALTLFTGNNASVHNFTLTLLIGIFSGTYSSIFNASMLLVIWDNGELGLGRLGGSGQRDRFASKRDREVRELSRSR